MNLDTAPKTPFVEFQAVRYLLPSGHPALDNVSFRIHTGEKIALLGNNGSGKTTIALLLAAILTPGSGFIRWHIHPDPTDIQLLMQNPSMQTLGSTVDEELRFGPELLRWNKQHLDELINETISKLRLTPEHLLTKLSGGELQQVVGNAIRILSPKLLIYDEPAMYLYPPRRKAMIEEALNEPCTVLWLTPNEREAALFPRTIVLEKGKVLFDGKKEVGIGTENFYHVPVKGKPEINSGNEIRVENVVVKGEEKNRLQIDKLVIREGERIGVIGDNGSGKTSLLALLGKVLKPDSGEIRRSPAFPMTSLSFQFPEIAFLTSSVREEIGGPDPSVNEQLSSVRLRWFGLEPELFLNRDPFTLSGGEARRVALASSIYSRDTFLLWDEPTAGLDLPGSKAIANVLQEQTAGFIVAGHDFDLIKATCDRVIMLENGSVKEDKSCAEFFTN